MVSVVPFITIITPTLNAEKYIEECIASVVSQSFTNYEHIIVDGISSDNTVAIIKKIQEQNNRLRLIVEKDKGLYDAMNKGIAYSKSEWLYFLGADDTLNDNHVLENIAKIALDSKAQIIYGDVYFKKLNRVYGNKFDVEKIITCNVCHQAIFYQRSVFEKMGQYDLRYSIYADYDFNLRCWLNSKIVHLYVLVIIANYQDGAGLSYATNDSKLFTDYPAKIVSLIINGEWAFLIRIHYLSKAYRKIWQRYSFMEVWNNVIKKELILSKSIAVIWMFISLPFYVIKRLLATAN